MNFRLFAYGRWQQALRIVLLVGALCANVVQVKAQQDPAFNQYWKMEAQVNPAAVGRTPQLNITAAMQTHAIGYEDAGMTMYAGADVALQLGKSRHGLGASFQNDQIALFSHKRIALQYALHFRLFGGTFSIGAQADMLAETIKGSKADLIDSSDPALPTTDLDGSRFDASVGLFYAHRYWYVGLSAAHLTAPTVTLGETNQIEVRRAYYLTVGGNIKTRNPLFTVRPSALARYDGYEWRTDVTLRLNYQREKKRLYCGLNYAPLHSAGGFIGGTFHGIDISYAYEAFTSGLGIGAGQHEITLCYLLDLDFSKKGKNRHRSVRWL